MLELKLELELLLLAEVKESDSSCLLWRSL